MFGRPVAGLGALLCFPSQVRMHLLVIRTLVAVTYIVLSNSV
jgi:hypothetical protein